MKKWNLNSWTKYPAKHLPVYKDKKELGIVKMIHKFKDFLVKAPKKGADPRLKRAGVSGYNKAKRTPKHPTKSHIVVAKAVSYTHLRAHET